MKLSSINILFICLASFTVGAQAQKPPKCKDADKATYVCPNPDTCDDSCNCDNTDQKKKCKKECTECKEKYMKGCLTQCANSNANGACGCNCESCYDACDCEKGDDTCKSNCESCRKTHIECKKTCFDNDENAEKCVNDCGCTFFFKKIKKDKGGKGGGKPPKCKDADKATYECPNPDTCDDFCNKDCDDTDQKWKCKKECTDCKEKYMKGCLTQCVNSNANGACGCNCESCYDACDCEKGDDTCKSNCESCKKTHIECKKTCFDNDENAEKCVNDCGCTFFFKKTKKGKGGKGGNGKPPGGGKGADGN